MKNGVWIGFENNQIAFNPDNGSIVVSGFKFPLSFEAELGDVSVDDIKNLAAYFNKVAEFLTAEEI